VLKLPLTTLSIRVDQRITSNAFTELGVKVVTNGRLSLQFRSFIVYVDIFCHLVHVLRELGNTHGGTWKGVGLRVTIPSRRGDLDIHHIGLVNAAVWAVPCYLLFHSRH